MNRAASLYALFAILSFFIVGLMTLNHYGYGDDEYWLLFRGERASQIISKVCFGRTEPAPLPGSEDDFSRFHLKGEQWNYHASLSGKETWSYHPSLYAFINYRMVSRFLKSRGVPDIPSMHFLNIFMATLALAALWMFSKTVVGHEAALCSVVLMMLFPRFVAHAHYNPKNIPALGPLIMSVLYQYRCLVTGRKRDALISGLWMGVATAVNLQSLELAPIFPLLLLFYRKPLGDSSTVSDAARPFWLYSGLFLLPMVITLYLLWPTLWIHPLFLLDSLSHFASAFDRARYLYFGNPCMGEAAPWHYYPFFLFVSTPLLVWFFAAVGAYQLARNKEEPQQRLASAILCLWIGLPLLIRMNPWAVKYDQLRHIFHVIPPLMVFAGCGFCSVLESSSKHRAVICLFLLGYFGTQIVSLFPYEGEYFNEAFRLFFPREIEAHFEFPVWQTPYKESFEWLNIHSRPGAVVRVPHMYYVAQLYQNNSSLKIVENGNSDYTLVSGADYSTRGLYFGKTPAFEIRRYQSLLAAVYQDR